MFGVLGTAVWSRRQPVRRATWEARGWSFPSRSSSWRWGCRCSAPSRSRCRRDCRRACRASAGAGFGGAFLMGLVGGIIAAPCTGPPLASLLAYVTTTRDAAWGFITAGDLRHRRRAAALAAGGVLGVDAPTRAPGWTGSRASSASCCSWPRSTTSRTWCRRSGVSRRASPAVRAGDGGADRRGRRAGRHSRQLPRRQHRSGRARALGVGLVTHRPAGLDQLPAHAQGRDQLAWLSDEAAASRTRAPRAARCWWISRPTGACRARSSTSRCSPSARSPR